MQDQQQTNWCWAATAVSVALFYDAAFAARQCDLANTAFKQTTCCTNGASNACNSGYFGNLALDMVGHLKSVMAHPPAMSDIISEIDAGRPVSMDIQWVGAKGVRHSIVIDGYDATDPAAPTIDIKDPAPENGPSCNQDFSTFPANYHGGASWIATFLTC